MELTTTEVLERIAEGDMQTVIRNIADPLERWELACRVQAIHVADEDCLDGEQVGDLVEAARGAIYDALRTVDEELSDAIADAMDTEDEKTRTREIREALDGYVTRRCETLLANLRGKEKAASKMGAVIAGRIAESEAAIRSTGPTMAVVRS